MILSIVVLPHPEGPTSTPISPRSRPKITSRKTSARSPETATKAFRMMRTSSRPESPAGRASLKGLHQQRVDREDDSNEGHGVGQNTCHVEQLECNSDLKPDAVRSAEQFDDKDDLPYQRQARSRRCRQVGSKLRQHNVPQNLPSRQCERLRHLIEAWIQ